MIEHTKADEDPLERLVAGGLQVKQGKFIVCAVLGFMADGLKQCRCPVELMINNKHPIFIFRLLWSDSLHQIMRWHYNSAFTVEGQRWSYVPRKAVHGTGSHYRTDSQWVKSYNKYEQSRRFEKHIVDKNIHKLKPCTIRCQTELFQPLDGSRPPHWWSLLRLAAFQLFLSHNRGKSCNVAWWITIKHK